MTPAARVQASIELLDQVIAAARDNGPPADRVIADGLRLRRYAGSSDRRAIRDLTYAAIRACGPLPANGRAMLLRLAGTDGGISALFDGSEYGPMPIGDEDAPAEGGIAPAWIEARLAASDIAGDEAAALLGRAPLDLRVNTLKASRVELELPLEAEKLVAPNGLRLPGGTPVEQWHAYRAGLVEIQDCGSQLACEAVGAKPGETVIDLCAGAGGKTLALAAAMENSGVLVASDTDRGRLSQLMPRAERAGAAIVEARLLNPNEEAEMLADLAGAGDAVLVDAPCSGSGTWRRNPENRWRLTEARLADVTALQDRLLDLAATLVKPGGRLVFVTCSLLDEEGPERFARFLERHPEWRANQPGLPLGRARGQGIRLTPAHDGTDGFFIARAEFSC
jgi:16S rRNA (cytosine967-C5)-methyltransferase